jgi:TetR/AcrR family transcriptional regulator, transcriptional repressor for nem operon
MKRIHDKGEIILAGLDIVLSKGFTATGVEAILKRANVPKGSFYNFSPSKEEFSLAIIGQFVVEMGGVLKPILKDDSLPPLERIKKCLVRLTERFESNNCSKGCLIGNLGLEMSDQCESFRQRLEDGLQLWAKGFSDVLREAQKKKAISADLDPEMLAENLISSFQGALLRSKVKKSSEPLRNFIHLYFDRFLA